MIFLDLTHHEIVLDEDHESPDASAEQLEAIGNRFVEILENNTDESRSTNKNYANVTIRKKNRFHINNEKETGVEAESFTFPDWLIRKMRESIENSKSIPSPKINSTKEFLESLDSMTVTEPFC